MKEQWRNIYGVKGEYRVSNMGRVKSFNRIEPMIMKQMVKNNGYLSVSFRDGNNIVRPVLVHRLVAMCFCSGWKPELQVNHIDGNKKNNHATNLEWVTPKVNTRHALDTGLYNAKGEKHWGCRFTEKDIYEIRELSKSGLSSNEVAIVYGVTRQYIRRIVRKELWRHI
jgi:hypothetical protein